MAKPININFYIDTSMNIKKNNLNHYSIIINEVLENFRFLTTESSMHTGKNRIRIYGYNSIRDKVKTEKIWESPAQFSADHNDRYAFDNVMVQ